MKKYVIVGTGGRSTMFQDALSGEFGKTSCLTAICDNNKGRLEWTKNEMGLADSFARFEEHARTHREIASLLSWPNHPNKRGHQMVADEIMKYFPV